MVNATLSIPKGLYSEVRRYPELEWGNIVRLVIIRKIAEIKLTDKILSKSKLTESEAETIGHRIKKEVSKRFN
jgi:hypothetical protein